MNRVIKFRAWDKVTRKMIATGFHVIGEVTMFSLIDQYLFENKEHGQTTLERLDDVVIMQFTGLQDKNGKDIYEGDLLAYEPYQYKVVFEDAKFVAYHTKYDFGKWGDLCRFNYLKFDVEIIGNIYEANTLY